MFSCYNHGSRIRKTEKQLGRGGMPVRNEKEMMDLILGVAEKDERIQGVYMTGSRTNPNAPKDVFH